MWNLHSHHHRNIPGGHANLCSLLKVAWPGRHLFSGHSTWVQACAWTFLLEWTLAAFFLHKGTQIFVCWASHRLRLGERRSSSSSGDNPDFKENLKTTSIVTSRPRTAPVFGIVIVSLGPTHAAGEAGGGCSPWSSHTQQCKPQDLPSMQ